VCTFQLLDPSVDTSSSLQTLSHLFLSTVAHISIIFYLSIIPSILVQEKKATFKPGRVNKMKPTAVASFTLFTFSSVTLAGPIAYGICQAGCAAVAMACYSAAGMF
jgi:hypothetical protein